MSMSTVMDVLNLNLMIKHGTYINNNLERRKNYPLFLTSKYKLLKKNVYHNTIIFVENSHSNYLKNLF